MSYSKITDWNDFKSTIEKKTNCNFIMSRWNKSAGLHTFYVSKIGSTYYGYNFVYSTIPVPYYSIDSFNNGNGFIVGYDF